MSASMAKNNWPKIKLSDSDIESKPIEDVKPGLPLLQRIAGSKKNNSKKHIKAKAEENKRVPNY